LQEIRDAEPAVLDRLHAKTLALARRVSRKRGLGLETEELLEAEPVRMAPRIQAAIEGAAGALGLRTKRMPSGAGHDAQIVAAVADAGMVFIPSQGGRSHRPDEWSDWEAIERGANVLLGTLLRLGGEPSR
jgi:N-carbamoyl-L-amino-acid hydrolase